MCSVTFVYVRKWKKEVENERKGQGGECTTSGFGRERKKEREGKEDGKCLCGYKRMNER